MKQASNIKPQFASPLWAGYECCYALPRDKKRLDLLAATKHDEYCQRDYRLIKEVGIKTVREGLAWSMIDKGHGQYDFSRFEKMMEIGKQEKIQQIWDLNHFDYPEFLDPFTDDFINAFASYAKQAASVIRKYQKGEIYIVPWNEISFTAWMSADQGNWAPYTKGSNNGFRLKRQLVKAVIAAMDAIWDSDNTIRFIHVDPLMRRHPKEPIGKKAIDTANEFNNIIRWEAWDMIAGKTYPEVGGDPKYLDILGINYYFHNQMWILSDQEHNKISDTTIEWDSPDRVPFGSMLEEVYGRYERPMVLSETGSYGDLRARWWKRILGEIDETLENGLPVYGVCSYPTVDKPEWIDWLFINSGLWDFATDDPKFSRIPHRKSLELIKEYSKRWSQQKISNGAIQQIQVR